MSVPWSAFILFFTVLSLVSVILIAKIRSDYKRRADAELPSAHLVGTAPRAGFMRRLREPGGYFLGFGLSGVTSLAICVVLAWINARPKPVERRSYEIHDFVNGTTTVRELTDKELSEQYETVPEAMRRLRAEHADDAGIWTDQERR